MAEKERVKRTDQANASGELSRVSADECCHGFCVWNDVDGEFDNENLLRLPVSCLFTCGSIVVFDEVNRVIYFNGQIITSLSDPCFSFR